MTTSRKRISEATRRDVFRKFNGCCAYCGNTLFYSDMQVDHVTPVHRGGTNDPSNLVPSCRSCNYYKGTRTVEEFRSELENLIPRLRGYFLFRLAQKYGLAEAKIKQIKFYFEEVKEC